MLPMEKETIKRMGNMGFKPDFSNIWGGNNEEDDEDEDED